MAVSVYVSVSGLLVVRLPCSLLVQVALCSDGHHVPVDTGPGSVRSVSTLPPPPIPPLPPPSSSHPTPPYGSPRLLDSQSVG